MTSSHHCHHPKCLGTLKKHVSTYTQPSSEQYEKECSQADGFRSVTGNYDHVFCSRVSCCRFYRAYFCPAKRRDIVHLNRFEQAWGRFVRDRRCCSWMFMVESRMLSSKRAWSRSGPKSAQKCTVLVRDHTKKNQAWKTRFLCRMSKGIGGAFLRFP